MKKLITTTIALLLATAALPARGNAEERKDGMRFIPDVIEAFGAMNETPEILGFHRTTTPNPSSCKHYQGIVRVNGADGTPFFLVTKSGNLPGFPGAGAFCNDSPGETGNGNLIVFRMDSRNKTGERMRSNRLKKGTRMGDTEPPLEDRATIFFTVAEGGLVLGNGPGGLVPRSYRHPGGMQVVGHVLAMASEARRDPRGDCLKSCMPDDFSCQQACNQIQFEIASSPTKVTFLDVSDPEAPGFLSEFAPVNEHGDQLTGCDGLAVTPLPGGRYLLAVTPGFNVGDPIYFYRSLALPGCEGTTIDPNADCTLANPNITWEFVAKQSAPDTKDPIQALHFIREDNMEGTLYLAASNGYYLCASDDCDRINLFTVNCQTADCAPGETITFTVNYRGKRITARPSLGGDEVANLAAAAGFYESPSGELIFYATEHDNDGPNGTVKAGEWRYESIVRGDSPTFLPTVTVDTTQEVDEGSQLLLTGQAGSPITKAWTQLYTNSTLPWLLVDYEDRELDDFDAFWALAPFDGYSFGFMNQATARHWFAPQGCSVVVKDLIDEELQVLDPPRVRTSAGTGNYELEDLEQVFDDGDVAHMSESIDALQYSAGCDAYYGGPFTLFWDTAGDGSYAQHGDQITFDASHRDGPNTATIPVQSRHATISGPPPGEKTVTITVKNVPPAVTPLALEDGAGNTIGADVPFVLTNAPVTASVTFTDPGVADTQTATLDWGDGVVDPSSAFASFVEATGGVVGSGSQAHVYTVPASAVTVQLAVTDDDGGVGSTSASIRVVSPEQALLEMLAMIDAVIAQTSDRTTLKQLHAARRAIVGSAPDSADGALNMVRTGYEEAAIPFVEQVAYWLGEAKARGADVATIINIAEALVVALSAA